MKTKKTFKGFDLDKNGCVMGAYPSFNIHSELQKATETMIEKENEYVLRIFTSMNIDPDVLAKQKAEIERLCIENEQQKAKIEKMKCCGNCFHNNKPSDKEFCWNCERQLNDEQPIVKDEWEITE